MNLLGRHQFDVSRSCNPYMWCLWLFFLKSDSWWCLRTMAMPVTFEGIYGILLTTRKEATHNRHQAFCLIPYDIWGRHCLLKRVIPFKPPLMYCICAQYWVSLWHFSKVSNIGSSSSCSLSSMSTHPHPFNCSWLIIYLYSFSPPIFQY